MKKFYAFLVAFLATTSIMYAQSYYYESFDYPLGHLGLNTGPASPAVNPATSESISNWNFGDNRSAEVKVGSITYPGLLTSATSTNLISLVNSANTGTTTANIRMVLTTAPLITTPVYFSFLMKVNSVPAALTRVASLRGTTNSSGTFAPRVNIAPGTNSGYKINIDGGTSSPFSETGDMIVGDVVLIVVKYSPNITNTEAITDVWINPSASDLGAGSAPTPTIAGVTGGVIKDIDGFTFRTGAASSVVNAVIDELRVGATWADVTPADTTSSLNNISYNNSLKLSTNVLNSQVHIIGGGDITKVDIYSIDSKLVKSVTVSENGFISTNDLPGGLFVVKLTSGNMTNTLKAVKP
jgi:hypothetical protein